MSDELSEWVQAAALWLALSLIALLAWLGKKMHSDVESLKATSGRVEAMTSKLDALDVDVRKQLLDQRDRGDASTADYRQLIREVHQKIEGATHGTNKRIDKLAETMSEQHATILQTLLSMRNGK